MRLLTILRAVLGVILGLVGVADAGALSWSFFTTRKADVQGPSANPTPAQQTASAAGDVAGGAGQGAAAAGNVAKALGENPALLLVGGLAVVLIAMRR